MQRVIQAHIDLDSLVDTVGHISFAGGQRCLRERAVGHVSWDGTREALCGSVHGRLGEFYSAVAYLGAIDEIPMEFLHGECSCPDRFDCEHVAAVVLAVAKGAGPRTGGTAATASPAWERSLEAMLGFTEPRGEPARTALAIELTLTPDSLSAHARALATGRAAPAAGTPLKPVARLVRPGKNGGWVAGNLSWGKLSTLSYQHEYPAEQVRLAQEMYAAYASRPGRSGYYSYGYGDERYLDLSAFGARQLWPLLDEAEAAGIRLVYGKKLGPAEKYHDAELCLDVTRPSRAGPLTLASVIRTDGAVIDAVLLGFLGSDGHGAVYAHRDETERGDHNDWRFRLARLAKPVRPELQRMVLAGQRVQIPAAQAARFAEAFYPRLRQVVAIISSDGTFEPPEISGPTLALRAAYRPGHQVQIDWEWAYQLGGSTLRAPLDAPPAEYGYRDPQAERKLLAGLDVPLGQLSLPGPGQALDNAAPGVSWPAALTGTDTMRFTTELLPLLTGQPGISVEITGEPADYREASDSLAIGVSTGEIAGETDWFDLGITITVAGRPVPFADVFVALSRGDSHLLLPDGIYFSLDKPELRTLAALITEAQALHDTPAGTLTISRYQAGLWDELTRLGVVASQASAWQRQVQGLLDLDAIRHAEPPATLAATLRPYQVEGFGWLAFLWEHHLGGILADDMGLGKTLQTLALISHAVQAEPDIPPFLIVAPTSVVSNWAAEAARFTPGLPVVAVTETAARRGLPLSGVIGTAKAVVTSYTLLRIDFDEYRALGWAGLILDEAQNAKNHQSKLYQCARRLPAPFKIAVTGTPMENNLMELWALLSITAPGLFPSPARFRDYYGRPIERQGQSELLAQLRQRIRPLVKRRTKEQVAAELPPKQEQVLEIDLHPRHRKLYQTHLQRERQKVLGLIGDLNTNRFTILRSLTLLRQLSLHAAMVDAEHGDVPSAKIDALMEQLRDVTGSGHRALVFSQFTRFLSQVRGRLDADGVPYCYLDGRTRDRPAVLRRFKEGTVPVFLISLKAGGSGLNLTEADYCFLLDPWWNPATEAQAVDRAHRIGQTRNVMVYRLIARDTIEEKVMALKARKAELFASVIDDGNVFGSTLTADDIRGLFT